MSVTSVSNQRKADETKRHHAQDEIKDGTHKGERKTNISLETEGREQQDEWQPCYSTGEPKLFELGREEKGVHTKGGSSETKYEAIASQTSLLKQDTEETSIVAKESHMQELKEKGAYGTNERQSRFPENRSRTVQTPMSMINRKDESAHVPPTPQTNSQSEDIPQHRPDDHQTGQIGTLLNSPSQLSASSTSATFSMTASNPLETEIEGTRGDVPIGEKRKEKRTRKRSTESETSDSESKKEKSKEERKGSSMNPKESKKEQDRQDTEVDYGSQAACNVCNEVMRQKSLAEHVRSEHGEGVIEPFDMNMIPVRKCLKPEIRMETGQLIETRVNGKLLRLRVICQAEKGSRIFYK